MHLIRLLLAGFALRMALAVLLFAGFGGWLALGGAESLLDRATRPFEIAELKDRAQREGERGRDALAHATRREIRELRRDDGDSRGGPATLGSFAGEVGATVWRIARVPVAIAALVGAALLVLRTRARRRRRYRRFWLRPAMTEVVDRDRTARLWEAWHQQQALRWWERLMVGQPSFAPEVSAVPVGDGGTELRVEVVLCDGPRVEAFLGRLRGAWQHVRIEEVELEGRPWEKEVIRLKKRFPFSPKSLAIVAPRRDELGEHVVDELRALAGELRQPFTVQLAMVPTPGLYERRARAWIRRAERSQQQRSKLADTEFEGGAESLAWRGLFFGDVRVCARSRRVCEQVAGMIQGGLRAENLLRPRWMIVRRALYASRVREGRANPMPSWRRGVFSSAECAALWALPTPFREAGESGAESEPRLEASHRLPRVKRDEALLQTQRGEYVGIDDESLRLGLAIMGAQYMGKSAALHRWFASCVGRPNTAGILLDAKGDTAEAAMCSLPPDATVHYVNFEHPEAGFSPLLGDLSYSEKAEAVTAAMVEANRTDQGESTVLSSSRRFIHQVVMAAVRAYDPPTFWHTWLLCSPEQTMDRVRLELAKDFGPEREMAGVALAFQQLSEQLRGARSAFIQRLDAPANKFYMLAGDPQVDRVLRHPHQVDIDRVIAEREILVVNGAIGRFGPELTSMLMLMLLTMVHRAILRQQSLSEHERARVALGLDEAHLFFSPTLQQMLSMDRAAGLMAALAWHFREQIGDRAQRAAAFALLRNRLFFALEREDARELSDLLQPIHVDTLHARQEVREVIRIGPEVLTNLERYHCAVDQVHEGRRVPSWIGTTLPMEGRDELREYHLERQRERGGRPASREDLDLPPGLTSEAPPPSALGGRGEGSAPARPEGRPDADAPTDGAPPGADERRVARAERTARGDPTAVPPPPDPGPRADAAHPAPPVGGPPTRPPADAPARPAARRHRDGDRREEQREAAVATLPPGTPTSERPAESYRELARYERATGEVKKREETVARNPTPRTGRPRAGETEGERQARRRGLWVLDESGPLPDGRDLEILGALWELDFLAQPQIAHHFLPGVGAATVRKRMNRLYKQGWVNRLVISTRGSGRDPYVYMIARGGFEVARLVMTRRGTAIDQATRWPQEEQATLEKAKEDRPTIGEAKWRQSEKQALTQILHDLGAAEWTLRLARDLAVNCVIGWRGPKGSYVAPPTRGKGQDRQQLALEEIPKPAPGNIYAGLEERWQWVQPDARVECEADLPGGVRRFDLFVEYERQRKPNERFERKVRAYDAFLTAWWRATDRYGKQHGEPGALIVVCSDGDAAKRYAEAADRRMTGAELAAGRGAERAAYPGRARIYFCAEVDVQQRTTRAFGLHPLPPAVRERLGGNAREREGARASHLRVVNFLPHQLLERAAELVPPRR